MKTVFNASEVAHVWAAQSQDTGRNSGGSFYFRGPAIFSYRDTWLLAAFMPWKNSSGLRVVISNADSYSNTTSRHASHVWRALRGHAIASHALPGLTAAHVPGYSRDAFHNLLDAARSQIVEHAERAAKRRADNLRQHDLETANDARKFLFGMVAHVESMPVKDWRANEFDKTKTRAAWLKDARALLAAADFSDTDKPAAVALVARLSAYESARMYASNLRALAPAVSAMDNAAANGATWQEAYAACMDSGRGAWIARNAGERLARAAEHAGALAARVLAVKRGAKIGGSRESVRALVARANELRARGDAIRALGYCFNEVSDIRRQISRAGYNTRGDRTLTAHDAARIKTSYTDAWKGAAHVAGLSIAPRAIRQRLRAHVARWETSAEFWQDYAARLARAESVQSVRADIETARAHVADIRLDAAAENVRTAAQQARNAIGRADCAIAHVAPAAARILVPEIDAVRVALNNLRDVELSALRELSRAKIPGFIESWRMFADAWNARGANHYGIKNAARMARDKSAEVSDMLRQNPLLAEIIAEHADARDALAALETAGAAARDWFANESAAALAAWRAGESVTAPYDAPTALRLSRNGAEVETSRGARVSVQAARILWRIVRRVVASGTPRAWEYAAGPHVGAYRLETIAADGSVKIGCHEIGAAELCSMAAALGFPSITDAAADSSEAAAA